jgi:hypothetical protein
MKKKDPDDKFRRVTVTLPVDVLQFLKNNAEGGLFKNVSHGVQKIAEDFMSRVAETPAEYYVKPVLPDKKTKR